MVKIGHIEHLKKAESSAHFQENLKVKEELKTSKSSGAPSNSPIKEEKTLNHIKITSDILFKFIEYWNKEDNYTGEVFGVNLNTKLRLFKWKVTVAQINSQYWPDCFRQILGGEAMYFALYTFQDGWSLKQMVEALNNRFETDELKSHVFHTLQKTTFGSLEEENPDKTELQVLELLISKIKQCDLALKGYSPRNPRSFPDLMSACAAEPSFHTVYCCLEPQNFDSACSAFRNCLTYEGDPDSDDQDDDEDSN